MLVNTASWSERLSLIMSVLAGLLVSIWLSPWDTYFWGNFAIFWIPQLVILVVLLFFVTRQAVLTGIAAVLALYLALFSAWASSSSSHDGLTWLGYLFSLPGAGLGAIVGAIYLEGQTYRRAFTYAAIAAMFTFVGLAINQAVMCSTVMYCGS
ncbi:MAG: hypothetical protein V9E91_02260 [Burkholderiaceae bacterium]|jgi:hypothetical protein